MASYKLESWGQCSAQQLQHRHTCNEVPVVLSDCPEPAARSGGRNDLIFVGIAVARDRNYIGSYRLLKLVRAGATCQIWEVISEVNNRRCALKVLKDEHSTNKDEIGLLKHEFQVGHALHHPNVIEIYEFDVARGIPFLALEYFDSSNLKQWIRQEADSDNSREALPAIIRGSAEGLSYLHEQGWVHRDIKPDNFLVNQRLEVKLIDFAIAEKIKKGFARFLSSKPKVQGTRSYMSPEQIRGEQPDVRSDIYSYGCMLFELFCGRPPFTGGSPDELLQKHLKAPIPSVIANNSEVSPEFADLISRMMSKSPGDRPGTMREFLEQFETMRMIRLQRR